MYIQLVMSKQLTFAQVLEVSFVKRLYEIYNDNHVKTMTIKNAARKTLTIGGFLHQRSCALHTVCDGPSAILGLGLPMFGFSRCHTLAEDICTELLCWTYWKKLATPNETRTRKHVLMRRLYVYVVSNRQVFHGRNGKNYWQRNWCKTD